MRRGASLTATPACTVPAELDEHQAVVQATRAQGWACCSGTEAEESCRSTVDANRLHGDH